MKTKNLLKSRSFLLNFMLPLLCFQWPGLQLLSPALGGDARRLRCGWSGSQPQTHVALLHLGGRLAMLIKNYNLHENDKGKREETDRVCPQPNPFCLSTFDLNFSRNTELHGPSVGNIEKGQQRRCRSHGPRLLYKCRWRCILCITVTPRLPALAFSIYLVATDFFSFFPAFFPCSSRI